MKTLLRLFSLFHSLIAFLLTCAALFLIALSAHIGWNALTEDTGLPAAQHMIEAIGVIAIAVVALQIAQTIAEEEVVREAHISAPTRVRRYLSRFMVVIVVALALEGLVSTFKALHENPTLLPYAASILAAVALLLAGWGIFIRMNEAAEKMEPEGMKQAKEEDKKVQ